MTIDSVLAELNPAKSSLDEKKCLKTLDVLRKSINRGVLDLKQRDQVIQTLKRFVSPEVEKGPLAAQKAQEVLNHYLTKAPPPGKTLDHLTDVIWFGIADVLLASKERQSILNLALVSRGIKHITTGAHEVAVILKAAENAENIDNKSKFDQALKVAMASYDKASLKLTAEIQNRPGTSLTAPVTQYSVKSSLFQILSCIIDSIEPPEDRKPAFDDLTSEVKELNERQIAGVLGPLISIASSLPKQEEKEDALEQLMGLLEKVSSDLQSELCRDYTYELKDLDQSSKIQELIAKAEKLEEKVPTAIMEKIPQLGNEVERASHIHAAISFAPDLKLPSEQIVANVKVLLEHTHNLKQNPLKASLVDQLRKTISKEMKEVISNKQRDELLEECIHIAAEFPADEKCKVIVPFFGLFHSKEKNAATLQSAVSLMEEIPKEDKKADAVVNILGKMKEKLSEDFLRAVDNGEHDDRGLAPDEEDALRSCVSVCRNLSGLHHIDTKLPSLILKLFSSVETPHPTDFSEIVDFLKHVPIEKFALDSEDPTPLGHHFNNILGKFNDNNPGNLRGAIQLTHDALNIMPSFMIPEGIVAIFAAGAHLKSEEDDGSFVDDGCAKAFDAGLELLRKVPASLLENDDEDRNSDLSSASLNLSVGSTRPNLSRIHVEMAFRRAEIELARPPSDWPADRLAQFKSDLNTEKTRLLGES